MRIAQVSPSDGRGGAESVAVSLHNGFRERGHSSWLLIGRKHGSDPNVLPLPQRGGGGLWARACRAASAALSPLEGKLPGATGMGTLLRGCAEPRRGLEWCLGVEDFNFSGSYRLLDLPPQRPDIVNCHNLHGGYFDLRALPWISQRVPTVLTLHDAWLLAGHCAHALGCERWRDGCGHCPDLAIYPGIRGDATAYNWRRKRDIYRRSRLFVTTPSAWLMKKVEQSILADGLVDTRLIPNGVDLSVFKPGDRAAVRAELGISRQKRVLLFAANSIRDNPWKDYATMRAAVNRVATLVSGQRVLFLAVGEDAPSEASAEVQFVPFQRDPRAMARYYQAADVYVHAARADTFPTSVLEALACGTPVVATAVGGIPEQIRSLDRWPSGRHVPVNPYPADEATGCLVPPGDAEAMAMGIAELLINEPLRRCLALNAVDDARVRFNFDLQVESYLEWFAEIVEGGDPARRCVEELASCIAQR